MQLAHPYETVPRRGGIQGPLNRVMRDSRIVDLILKLVNLDSSPRPTEVTIQGGATIQSEASQAVLAGDPKGFNTFASPRVVVPATSKREVGRVFSLESRAAGHPREMGEAEEVEPEQDPPVSAVGMHSL